MHEPPLSPSDESSGHAHHAHDKILRHGVAQHLGAHPMQRPALSLLHWSLMQRLGLVTIALLFLWMLVWWALQ